MMLRMSKCGMDLFHSATMGPDAMALSDELAHLEEYAAEARGLVRICLACKILSYGITISYVYAPHRSLSSLDDTCRRPTLSQVT